MVESIDRPPVHEVETHKTYEGKRLVDGVLYGLCGAQEQIGDHGDVDLDAHRIL